MKYAIRNKRIHENDGNYFSHCVDYIPQWTYRELCYKTEDVNKIAKLIQSDVFSGSSIEIVEIN